GVDLPYRAKSNMGQMSSDAELPGTDLSESIDWETFLTSVPPGSERLVRDAAYFDLGRFYLAQPTIKCYCIHDYCKRHQLFSSLSEDKIISDVEFLNIRYICRNCGEKEKVFAVI